MKKILCLLIGLILSVPAYASIAVSPTKIEINANKLKNNYVTTAIEIRGDKEVPMRFKVYTGYFTISNKSEMIIQDKSNDPHDISKKIRFVPSEFTVLPNKTQKLRLNIANLKSLPSGESRAVLFLEDVNPKEYMVPNTAGIGAQLIIKTRVGIPIYVDNGKVSKIGDIETLDVKKEKDGLYTEMKIVSNGNAKIRYNARMQIIKGKKLVKEYALASKVVGDNNYYITKDKVETKNVPTGEYTLRAIISYDDENGKLKNIKKETTINIQGEI